MLGRYLDRMLRGYATKGGGEARPPSHAPEGTCGLCGVKGRLVLVALGRRRRIAVAGCRCGTPSEGRDP